MMIESVMILVAVVVVLSERSKRKCTARLPGESLLIGNGSVDWALARADLAVMRTLGERPLLQSAPTPFGPQRCPIRHGPPNLLLVRASPRLHGERLAPQPEYAHPPPDLAPDLP